MLYNDTGGRLRLIDRRCLASGFHIHLGQPPDLWLPSELEIAVSGQSLRYMAASVCASGKCCLISMIELDLNVHAPCPCAVARANDLICRYYLANSVKLLTIIG